MAEDRGRHDDHPLWTLVSRRRTKGYPACLLVADAYLFVGVTTSFLMTFLTIHHLALWGEFSGCSRDAECLVDVVRCHSLFRS